MGALHDDRPPDHANGPNGGGATGVGPPTSSSPEAVPESEAAERRRQASKRRREGDDAFRESRWDDAIDSYLRAKRMYEELGDDAAHDIDRRLVRVTRGSDDEKQGKRHCRAHHKLLVIDDDQGWRTLIRTQLRLDGEGHFEDVRYALDAFEAIETIGVNEGIKPDIILLDLRLPNMSGIEALPLILKGAPKAKVVVVSAYRAAAFRRIARDRGAADYVEKSEIKDFTAVLRDICCAA